MTRQNSHAMTAQDCLVALMVAISVSDETIRTSELVKIQSAVNNLPIFAELQRILQKIAEISAKSRIFSRSLS